MPAAPMPVPIHMETTPNLLSINQSIEQSTDTSKPNHPDKTNEERRENDEMNVNRDG